MALTKVKGSGLATGAATDSLVGIDDNATSTAITIDASENVTLANSAILKVKDAFGDTAMQFNVLSSGSNSGRISVDPDNTGASSQLSVYVDASEKLTVLSTGDVNVKTGNLVIGTSGKGIDFSATSDGSGTMTSEVLDDYEEGTWTPTVDYGTVSVASNYYTKVGNLVTVNALVYTFSDKTTAANIVIGGLPFTPVGEQTGSAMTRYFNAGEGGFVTYITSAGIRVYGLASSGANYDDVQHSQLGASARVYFNITYRVV